MTEIDGGEMLELARRIHADSAARGLWDEWRSPERILAYIHLRWSQALSLWMRGADGVEDDRGWLDGPVMRLMDGCIEILDFMAWKEIASTNTEWECHAAKLGDFPSMMGRLHSLTSQIVGYARYDGPKPKTVRTYNVRVMWGILTEVMDIVRYEYNKDGVALLQRAVAQREEDDPYIRGAAPAAGKGHPRDGGGRG